MTAGEADKIISCHLAVGFEAKHYQAALLNLEQLNNESRFNNFATAMRELMRNVMLRLAPDDQVRACVWYLNETGKKGGITRQQRARYAVQGGIADKFVRDKLGINTMEMHRALSRAIDTLSKYTHVTEKTFGLPSAEVDELVHETLVAVAGFFCAIDEQRKKLATALWEHIDAAAVDSALSDVIQALDEIATHHFIDEIYTHSVEVVAIDSERVRFEAHGEVSCELQWGSNSDVKKDLGAVMSDSFPSRFFEVWSAVGDPLELCFDDAQFSVDTSSWTDGWADE